MENPTPHPEHHQHHAHHSPEHDNQQPSEYKSRDFSSPLAQPPLTSPPPPHVLGEDHNDPLEPELEEQDLPSVPIHKLKSLSAPVVCPKCGIRAMTITRVQSGGFTHVVAGALLFSGALSWLAWVPYFISSVKDVLHQCGKCKKPIAEWHRSGRTEVLAYPEVNGVEDEDKDENKDQVEVEVKVEDKSRESRLL
ncbi:LITAF-like zinc ribbon domain-containing protein [Fusarium sp. MPI-SDFR-AT-0072]|uniref:LITAF domain-containing protein n=1 Tax=Fusarium oxysporum f. sp. rapae TaxID=485398 RepID=A0A8J5NXF7_FUSOX|nr:hypothetical protein Forpe1208_v008119 [Fusarium oxysporum f. sp. rapae]KAH7164893.1 LITAF-like zinc ribbon domain-containing protein [Fusarium sp. MPI-SDFR-AT-0072]KAI7770002.1 hypothetical protein LZL87_003492 [Fusarium oxysporum]